ncbi:MAG: MBL fold metallo-hydrolase, partial [Thermoguttaceae bacterium]
MKLQFLGAARQVTGSQYYLQANGSKILVDCGMYQERSYLERNWAPSLVRPRDIDTLLLTHAHVDHCGLAPKLVREGFRGRIRTTDASAELVEVILRDSAHIQMEDAAYKRKRHKKEGRKSKYPVEPLFTTRDVERTLRLLKPVSYDEIVRVNDDLSVVFHDAGHILGSAMVELRVGHNENARRVLFSGDIGQTDKPLVRDPTKIADADYLIMESTYGDRNHEDRGDVGKQLADVINRTLSAGGNLVIPTFAIERSQEVIYQLSLLMHEGRIPQVPVFLDSPMAVDATDIFRRYRQHFDEETWTLITAGGAPLKFPTLN